MLIRRLRLGDLSVFRESSVYLGKGCSPHHEGEGNCVKQRRTLSRSQHRVLRSPRLHSVFHEWV